MYVFLLTKAVLWRQRHVEDVVEHELEPPRMIPAICGTAMANISVVLSYMAGAAVKSAGKAEQHILLLIKYTDVTGSPRSAQIAVPWQRAVSECSPN